MIRINFCKTGASVSDWDIDTTVEFLKKTALVKPEYKDHPEWVYDYSNFLLLDALRAEIAEDKISLDNINFSVDDVPLEVSASGATKTGYPKQGLQSLSISGRILRAQRYHVTKEENSSLAKALKEGQAPASDRDSTTSREG